MVITGRQNTGTKEPRYVYYRVYAPDGAIPSRTASDRGNPFVGRIKATSVPPPHNVLSLKRTLGETESLPDPTGSRTSIYSVVSSTIAMDQTEAFDVLGQNLGATPETALALVFAEELSEKERRRRPSVDEKRLTPQYVYYRLHTLSGEDDSARVFDPTEPAIGRIDQMEIAPPRDVSSLKRCIARAEKKPIYAYADLYGDAKETKPWDSKTHLSGKLETFPGSIITAPLLLVQPERRKDLYNRPLKVLEAQSPARTSFWNGDLKWLAASAGEIFHTDGVERRENHREQDKKVVGYMAVGADGKTGLIVKGNHIHLPFFSSLV
ncbi:hypothetical protein B0H19DRAFT_1095133 [Mycena capillaripes]|nr:hypothetical protein B0H19DRAFT_1095133 [Mycena capillaripes]